MQQGVLPSCLPDVRPEMDLVGPCEHALAAPLFLCVDLPEKLEERLVVMAAS